MLSRAIQQLSTDRERLRQQHAAGASGLTIARGLAQAVDRAVLDLWGTGLAGVALVALGGYGRGLLAPASDVDLVFLHEKSAKVDDLVRAITYPLWDAGLEVGHGVFTAKQAVKLAGERFDVATAWLDARLLAGEATLLERVRAQVLEKAQKSGLVQRVTSTVEGWRASAGDVTAEMEPNLKEGRGGLREVAALGWLERIGLSQPGRYEDHAEVLQRVRNELHFGASRRADVLHLHDQPRVAEALGYPDASELMAALYRSARHIAHATDRATGTFGQGHPVHRFVEATDGQAGSSWSPEQLDAFLHMLRLGDPRTTLDYLDVSGALVEALPEWHQIQFLPQRNVYHRFAADVHSMQVVAEARSLESHEDDLVRRVAADGRSDLDTLLIAALLHDVGKRSSIEDHSVLGARLAETAGRRMRLEPSVIEDVVWLIEHHLLLAETATRRDIEQPSLVVEIADLIGSERRLRLLFLLTVADSLATGPSAWSRWKATLVGRLFTAAGHILEVGELAGGEASETAQQRVAELKAGLPDLPEAAVDAHVSSMPRAWLLFNAADELIRHTRLMLRSVDSLELSATAQKESGSWEVLVVAPDSPGLFSKVSGALALHGLNVLRAQAYTRSDHLALEVFQVEEVGDEEHRFERVAQDARRALAGKLALDVRLAQKRKDYSFRPAKGKQEPPRVVIDNRSSGFYTVVEVHAADGIGLLYAVTRVMSELSLDIHLAQISTYGHDVVDAFYVTEVGGQKVDDPQQLKELELALLHCLEVH